MQYTTQYQQSVCRVAILIESSNIIGQEDLPGARKDIKSWQKFLASSLGGEWDEDSEIIIKHKPISFEIVNLIQAHTNDYVFIAFSGHGCERTNSNGTSEILLCLNDKEQYVPAQSLTPAKFGTIILDCCRGHGDSTLETGVFNETRQICNTRALSFSERLTNISREAKRKDAFLSNLARFTRQNTLRMIACSSGEAAEEDPNAGGLYTTLLIASAREWEERAKKSSSASMIFTTKDAHIFAQVKMLTKGTSQTPEYKPSSVAYPFAVS